MRLSEMSALLVAERAPPSGPEWESLARESPRRWLVSSRLLGAFRQGGSWARLAAVGVEPAEGHSLNLLPPAARGEWDAELAARVGDCLRAMLASAWGVGEEAGATAAAVDWGPHGWFQRPTWRYGRLVACGRRVAAALGLGDVPTWSWRGGAFVAPHPSGLCRAWNYLDASLARGRVEAWLAGEPPDAPGDLRLDFARGEG